MSEIPETRSYCTDHSTYLSINASLSVSLHSSRWCSKIPVFIISPATKFLCHTKPFWEENPHNFTYKPCALNHGSFKSSPQTTMLLSTVSSLAVISLAVTAPQYGGVQPSRQVSPSSVQCRVETTVIWDTQYQEKETQECVTTYNDVCETTFERQCQPTVRQEVTSIDSYFSIYSLH